jgi:hypothetical protein
MGSGARTGGCLEPAALLELLLRRPSRPPRHEAACLTCPRGTLAVSAHTHPILHSFSPCASRRFPSTCDAFLGNRRITRRTEANSASGLEHVAVGRGDRGGGWCMRDVKERAPVCTWREVRRETKIQRRTASNRASHDTSVVGRGGKVRGDVDTLALGAVRARRQFAAPTLSLGLRVPC